MSTSTPKRPSIARSKFCAWLESRIRSAGRIVEQATTVELFSNPKHPYTQGLLASIPRLGKKQDRLHVITGSVPNPLSLPTGCAFRPRCPIKAPLSDTDVPALKAVGAEHLVACWQDE